MNFKDLQESWQAQPVKTIIDPYKLSEQKSRWQIRQRKLLRYNIILSLACLTAIISIAWVYIFNNHEFEFKWPFKVSIGTLCLLLVIICAISWKSYAFKKENLEVSSDHFINYQIRKLNWQRNIITKYLWIHTVLIWLALIMYTGSSHRTTNFKITALALITAYVFGITGWIRIKKRKKELSKLDGLIADLENMKEKLLENENI